MLKACLRPLHHCDPFYIFFKAFGLKKNKKYYQAQKMKMATESFLEQFFFQKLRMADELKWQFFLQSC
jgi:hypothetical protein